jgi:hypothetical protein
MLTNAGGDGPGKGRAYGLHYDVDCAEVGRGDVAKGSLGGGSRGSMVDFQDGLSDKRRYPVEQFRAFWDAGKRYAELTKNDPLIHRKVVAAINGLREFLSVERKRFPGTIIADADRLESLLFSGYDPYFEGDEPPGL